MNQVPYKVIAVDDEPHVLEGLKIMINWEQYGYQLVATFEQADAALDFMRKEDVDLVLTDVRMPGVNGFDFAQEIRKTKERPEIIMISGFKEFDYVKKAMALEVQDYLVKPIFQEDVYEVLDKMTAILDNKKKHNEVKQLSMIDLLRDYIRSQVLPGKEVRERLSHFEKEVLSKNLWVIYIYYDFEGDFSEIDLGITMFSDYEDFQKWLNGEERYIIYDYGTYQLEELRRAYRLLKTRLVHHTRQLKIHTLANNHWQLNYEYDKEVLKNKIDRLIESFEQAISKELFAHLSLLFIYCEEQCIPIEEVKKWLYDFYLKVVLRIEKYDKSYQKDNEPLQEKKDTIYLEEITTMETLYHFISEKLNELLSNYQMVDVEKPAIIAQIEGYMAKHYAERLTIKDLADQFYMHPNYLGQLMKQHWQMGFTEYLHRFRIKKATQLLKDEQTSIEEIAYLVGYINYQQFLKYYKLYTNQVPTVTRKDNESI